MADEQKKTVTILTPSGKPVNFVVGSDWSRNQIERIARQKRPELFVKQNVAQPSAQMNEIPLTPVQSMALGVGEAAKRSWQEQAQKGRNIIDPTKRKEMMDADLPRYAASVEMAGGGGGLRMAGKDLAQMAERRAAQAFASQPADMQIRKLVQSINPVESEWRSMMKNLTQGGINNVKEFAAKNGITLKTNLDLAKATRGAATETQGFYKRIIEPFKNEVMEIPRDSQVARIPTEGGTSSRATIEAVDQRLTKINDMLRSAYKASKAGASRESLAMESDLVAERDALAKRLYTEIGKKFNINPNAIRALRQQFGSLHDLADQVEGAVNRRAAGEARIAEGRNLPHSVAELALRGMNKLRGGATSIADRATARDLSMMDIP